MLVALQEGSTLLFTCQSYGKDVWWRLNNGSLPSNAHTSSVFENNNNMFKHTLTINHVNLDNNGKYSCHRKAYGFLQVSGKVHTWL